MSIYDDSDMWSDVNEEFAHTVKLTRVGDRVRGEIADITRFEGTGQRPAPKFLLANVAAREDGVQSRYETAELIAGTKSMKGQVYTMKPRKGDILDAELIELRQTGQPSPAKIFRLTVEGYEEAAGAADEEEPEPDIFGN